MRIFQMKEKINSKNDLFILINYIYIFSQYLNEYFFSLLIIKITIYNINSNNNITYYFEII
jgi:hypothetical protein